MSNHVCPFYPSDNVGALRIIAVCNGLWFVEKLEDNSMFVWNPSTGVYRKLSWEIGSSFDPYGLGYDSVAGDYKLLKISRQQNVNLYSLRSNSWRRFQSSPGTNFWCFSSPSCCVYGTLHWLYQTGLLFGKGDAIVSFDLSTEEYGQFALPPEYSSTHKRDYGEVTVLRGKLCLSLNYWEGRRFVLWVMEEYGVVKSWTKKLEIDHGLEFEYGLRPLYICDDWENGICVTRVTGECWVINKDRNTLVRKNLGSSRIYGRGFVYVESLVSPAMYVA